MRRPRVQEQGACVYDDLSVLVGDVLLLILATGAQHLRNIGSSLVSAANIRPDGVGGQDAREVSGILAAVEMIPSEHVQG